MQIAKVIKLTPSFINKIIEFSPIRKFTLSTHLFYEGQIPIVAYLVISGGIILSRNKKIKNVIKPGSIIGINELYNKSPSQMDAEVSPESTLCFLDKSTMLEIMNLKNSELSNLFAEIAKTEDHREAK
jgi:CRP-like cAMP-binding protein